MTCSKSRLGAEYGDSLTLTLTLALTLDLWLGAERRD